MHCHQQVQCGLHSYMFSAKFHRLWVISNQHCWPDDVIQNGWWDVMKSRTHYSDVIWPPWHLNSQATPLFVQPFVQPHKRKRQSCTLLALFERNPPVSSGFPSQRVSNAESLSMWWCRHATAHYSDVIMGTMASQITSLTIVYSTIYSDADQRKHQSSASQAFVPCTKGQ